MDEIEREAAAAGYRLARRSLKGSSYGGCDELQLSLGRSLHGRQRSMMLLGPNILPIGSSWTRSFNHPSDSAGATDGCSSCRPTNYVYQFQVFMRLAC